MFQAPTVCSLAHRSPRIGVAHPNYSRLVGMACDAHGKGRNPDDLDASSIARARLYAYAFRRQTIGAFHATRVALENLPETIGPAASHRLRAREILADLANLAVDPVPRDHRALLGCFYRYEYGVQRAAAEMDGELAMTGSPALDLIAARFADRIAGVRGCGGIDLARDDMAPDQGGFIVPGLGITIYPLVYGDYHSWNLAWLDPERSDVPHHLHRHGVEIHLGYGPMEGHVVLGDCRTRLTQGYALPIPPETRHGYVNDSPKGHHLPFIFGSMKRGGWGVFFDVDPRPIDLAELRPVPPNHPRMNGLVLIEEEILKASRLHFTRRAVVVPANRTDRGETGGLQLSLTRVAGKPFTLRPDRFLAFSVVSGHGRIRIADVEAPVAPHEHFAVPAGLEVELETVGPDPFILLDADLVPPPQRRKWNLS